MKNPFKISLENAINKYHYTGTCVDLSCSPYDDATEFAQAEENYKEVPKEYFLEHVMYNKVVDNCDIFYYDPEYDFYIGYDSVNDIHYFFQK